MKKRSKRLILNRETVKNLTVNDLEDAVGGGPRPTYTCPHTEYLCGSEFPC